MNATRSIAAYRGHQTRLERDEAVRVNIPADLLPLWEQTRSLFKGDAHSRFEQFTKYAEEHESDSIAAIQASADDKLDAMIREYESRQAA